MNPWRRVRASTQIAIDNGVIENMSQLGRVIKSAVKIVYWKCRYGKRFQTPLIQGFDRLHVELASDAGIRLGERIQNRGTLYMVCGQKGRLLVGAHVFFNTNSSVACLGRVEIGDYCKFGNNTVIVDHDHNYRNENGEYVIGEITIGNRVWVGANCTILRGAHIGDDCVIAAGSVVKSDVPAGTLYCQKRHAEMTPID